MKVTSLQTLQLANNYVLVKPDPGNHKVRLKSGAELFLDTSYEKEKHAVTSGIVVKVPERLIHYKEHGIAKLDFVTDQEVQIGDRIIYHYMQAIDNMQRSRYIESDGVVYFLIKYDSIFCTLRDPLVSELTGEPVETGWKIITPVNGYVFVEADEEELPSTSLIIPDMMLHRKSQVSGIIRYIGSPLQGYRDYPEWGADKDELRIGQRVLFSKLDSIPLQYPLHQTIDKDKTIYRMHRRDIYGVYEFNYSKADDVREHLEEVMHTPHDGNVI